MLVGANTEHPFNRVEELLPWSVVDQLARVDETSCQNEQGGSTR
jgi:hypothetical protein